MPDAPPSPTTISSAHVNRHAWALEKYGHLLPEALRKDTSAEARMVEKLPEQQIPAHIVRLILEKADPTQNKGMTSWLVGQYAQGKLRLEDLGTANETLTMFRRYAQRLEISQRDLGQYQSLAAVWEAVIGFANDEEQRLSGKAQKAIDRDKAYAESRILRQDPDGFTIAVPLTEFAAKWWGRGTRWCTAADQKNYFWDYQKDAPLIVIVIPELGAQGKFQLWIKEDEIQFMDASDTLVTQELIEQNWSRLASLVMSCMETNGRFLPYVPTEFRTHDLYRAAVRQSWRVLEFTPEEHRTEELCLLALHQSGTAFPSIPRHILTHEMCTMTILEHGTSLSNIPEPLRSAPLCDFAVRHNGFNLRGVPPGLITPELCEIAVRQNGRALEFVPRELRTQRLYELAVSENGIALRFVPPALCTEQLCETAITQDGNAFIYVPDALKTVALFEEAAKRTLGALKSVPLHICNSITEQVLVAKLAVEAEGYTLSSLPLHLRTLEVCEAAVRNRPSAFRFSPIPLRGPKLCSLAVALDGAQLEHVPQECRSSALCETAVTQDGLALQHVPKTLRTASMCLSAVRQNGLALEFVPLRLQTRTICQEAMEQNPFAIRHLPYKMITERVCAQAIEKNPKVLSCVPETLQTPRLCQSAIEQDGMALEWVAEQLRTVDLCEIAVRQNWKARQLVPHDLLDEVLRRVPHPSTSWSPSLLDWWASRLMLSTEDAPEPQKPRHPN